MKYRVILAALLLSALTALAQAHSVDLKCTAPTTGGAVTGFNVKRGTVAGGPYTTIASPTTCAFTDASTAVQTEGATFKYVFTATGPGGESSNSNEVSATIPFSKPDAPTAPTATPH